MTITLNGTTGITTNNIDLSNNLEVGGAGYNNIATLTDGTTINWDWSVAQVAEVTIQNYRTLNTPTNATTGQYSALRVNRTGNFSLSFSSAYKGISGISQSFGSGKIDHFVFRYNGTNFELVSFKADIGA